MTQKRNFTESLTNSMKQVLRTRLRSLLKELNQDELTHQSFNVMTQLMQLDLSNVEKVAVYMNFDHSEIKTDLIIKNLIKLNKRVFLPKCVKPTIPSYQGQKLQLQFLEMESYKQVEELKPQGRFKIREPNIGFDIMDDSTGLDLIIVPGLAFTKDLYRMGHGAGLYDDFIKRHLQKFNKIPYLLGVGLKQQLLQELPIEDHDETLDGLIIDNSFYGSNTI